ncbi:MAG: hypothetical protein GU359_08875 [Desulfurococcales archaeon]|nr:hypothetical protein [Desulfurococcales archaeon]MCI4457264.1 hypothetical protein [Desulfurococcaceae archaeon]NAZ14235.1 hypothetical protein [Desulfurococcales archaeon]
MSSQSKRLVPISENVVKELMEFSSRIGIPFRELVEKILISFAEVSRTNPHLINIIYNFDLLEDLRKIGGIILPQNFINKLIEKMSDEDLEELREELKRSSSWLGLLVKVKRGGSLENMIDILKIWLSNMKIDVIPLQNEKDLYKIVISSPEQDERTGLLIEAIIEGVSKAFDATIISRDIEKGIVVTVIRYGQS